MLFSVKLIAIHNMTILISKNVEKGFKNRMVRLPQSKKIEKTDIAKNLSIKYDKINKEFNGIRAKENKNCPLDY